MTRIPLNRAPLAIAALTSFTGAFPAHAQSLYARSTTNVFVPDPDGNLNVLQREEFESEDLPYFVLATRHSGSVTNGGGNTSGGVAVGYGYIRTTSVTEGFIQGFGVLQSSTTANFTDTIHFEDPAVPNGTPGAATLPISIIFNQSAGGGVINLSGMCLSGISTSGSVTIRIDGAQAAFGTRNINSNCDSGFAVNGSMPEELIVPINFVYGTPLTISVDVQTSAIIGGDGDPAQGFALSSFPNSIRAMGIQDLPATTTATGSIDWTKPAPVVPDKACPADINGDGELNFFDVAAFVALFQAQDPIADFNNDGLFNFFDFSAFIAAFNAGCP
ncbi:MAG: hypothetical protein LAT64_06440 [Phycisphaerales bacterium]|nr:hypothetical protein [Planctomycetota bacterium]MCH8508394.1 hypothetical protein [Phycisphaerales bacterium]